MARTVRAKEKKQTKKSVADDAYVAHSVQRMYSKTAPVLIVESVVFMVLGILMLVNPLGFLSTITFVFGCVLILIGFYRTVSGFIVSHETGGGWPDVLSGLISVIIGVLFLIFPLGSMVGLVYLFVVLFVFMAWRALVFAINMARVRFGNYVFNLVMAIALFCVSVWLLFYPTAGAAAVVIYVAVILMMYAVANLYMYWVLRRLKRDIVG